MSIFLCPLCGKEITDFPHCTRGNELCCQNGFYQFTRPEDQPAYSSVGYTNGNYAQHPQAPRPGYAECVKKLIDLYGHDAVYLDLGTGYGDVPIYLASHGVDSVALDISPHVLQWLSDRAAARGFDKNVQCVRMNLYNTCFVSSSVSVLIVNHIFRILNRPVDALAEMHRILKPNGVIANFTQLILSQNDSRLYDQAYSDIEKHYDLELSGMGYKKYWNYDEDECIPGDYFSKPECIQVGEPKETTISLEWLADKLRMQGFNRYQHIPEAVQELAWAATDSYAREKYGENYKTVSKSFQSQTILKLYKKK